MLERVLLVAAAGAVGSILRYAISGLVVDWVGPSTWGTFVVNITGAVILGFLVGVTEERWLAPYYVRTALAIGLLGAYTTFSTLMFETVDLAESRSFVAAGANVLGSVTAGLVAVYAGLVVGRSV